MLAQWLLKNDGSLWAWGANDSGQIGFANEYGANRYSPVPIKILDQVSISIAGYLNSMAIKDDGTLWVWGAGRDGQIGDGTIEDSWVPEKIMDNVERATTGTNHSLAVTKDGALWAWGDNLSSQLGLIETSGEVSPVKLFNKGGISKFVGIPSYSENITSNETPSNNGNSTSNETSSNNENSTSNETSSNNENSTSNENAVVEPDNSIKNSTLVLQVDNPLMTVNGVEKEIDAGFGTKPIILSGRTVVPVRAIIDQIGGSIQWNAIESKITILFKTKTLEMWINKTEFKINGITMQMDVPAQVINGRTMLPIRYIADNLEFKTLWDAPSRKITIDYSN